MDSWSERPVADLTGRARIRDAALVEFTDRGVRGATVRSIAARAGVSPALVQHHFGTKDALRAACDEFVLEFLRRQSKAGVDEDGVAEAGFMAAAFRASAWPPRSVPDWTTSTGTNHSLRRRKRID